MESDDDYASSSPAVQHRRLKRLKKAIKSPNSTHKRPSSIEDLIPIPRVDFAKLEALDASKTLGSDEDSENLLHFSRVDFAQLEALEVQEASKIVDSQNSSESLPAQSVNFEADVVSGFSVVGDAMNKEIFVKQETDLDLIEEKRRAAKRVLEFDDEINEAENNVEQFEKKPRSQGAELDEDDGERAEKRKTKKKKRSKSDKDGELKAPAVNKRKEEKDRKDYLKQLHADSQRILRETRDASFRAAPVVHKPISSVLEKIRKRKLEVSKKTTMSSNSYVSEKASVLQGVMLNLDSDDVEIEEIEVQKYSKPVEDASVERDMSTGSCFAASSIDGLKETTCVKDKKVTTQIVLDEKSKPSFRAPVDDTQDIFCDSHGSDCKDQGNLIDSPVDEEAFAPSLLAMKLKFDSALPDDSSLENENNDKENIPPHLRGDHNNCTSPKGDPVKAFIDEEAEEEEDSDDDIGFLKENEDEDIDDSEELNDIIATDYEERPIDDEKRNELHQKWLEQQDAAGTDNLLQRFKHSSKYAETTLLAEDSSDNEGGEEFNDEVENEVARSAARMTSKRAKQMIAQMFLDTDDGFLSDEDEEAEKSLMKQHLLVRSEEHQLVSPAEDESSRDFFGLIRKLNIAPDNKKKPKAASFFDTILRGSTNITSKSSFVGRISNHSRPSSHKQGACVVRSFVFGRDDSNSRTATSTTEDDTVLLDNQSSRSTIAKFSCSQTRSSSSQRSTPAGEMAAGSSLYEILKKASTKSSFCNQNNTIDLSRSMFNAFKLPRKPVKIEGRS